MWSLITNLEFKLLSPCSRSENAVPSFIFAFDDDYRIVLQDAVIAKTLEPAVFVPGGQRLRGLTKTGTILSHGILRVSAPPPSLEAIF